MVTSFKKISAVAACTILMALPFISGAQTTSDPPKNPETVPTAALSYKLNNPLKIDSLQELFVTILNLLIILAVPIVVFFIILAGFKYVVAQGNPAKIQEATQALTYAIIGGVIIIGAVAIAEIIKNLVLAI